MLLAVREAHHLVFDGRAVAWPRAFDCAGEHRRAFQPGADDGVGRAVRVRDVARHLARMVRRRGKERHRWPRLVAGLHLHDAEIHAAAIEARRRAGLQTIDPQRQRPQTLRQGVGRRIASTAARLVRKADVDAPAEKRAGRQHDALGLEAQPHLRVHAAHAVALDVQIDHRLLEHRQVRLALDHAPHGVPIQHPVRLRPRRLHRRPLASVQRPHLDRRAVGSHGHRPAQRVDLAHQMRLADAANGRIAGHLADGLDALRQEQRRRAKPRRSERRLGPGMTAADDDDIEALWMKHEDASQTERPWPLDGRITEYLGSIRRCRLARLGTSVRAFRGSRTASANVPVTRTAP